MKFLAFGLILLFSGCTSTSIPDQGELPIPDTASIDRPANAEAAQMVDQYLQLMDQRVPLIDSISTLAARDRYVRQVFIEMFSDPELDPSVRTAFQKHGGEYIEQIDAINTERLKVLLAETGWRQLAERENNAFRLAWRIVQHSNDEAFRESVLNEIEPLAAEGLIEGQQFALMYDKVQLKKDGTQLFGSQTKCINGQYDVYGLTAPDSVDARRAKFGMEPLAEYIEQNREYYGPCSD